MLPLRLDKPSGEPLRILCLGAHCDDIEIGAGATLRRLIAEREVVDVRWTIFASDPAREAEARASAADFLEGANSADVEVRAVRESYFPDQWAAIKDAIGEVRADFSPDLVLTHHRHDAHQDHRVLSELTWNAFRDHLILEYEIPKYEGDLGRPNLFVPISEAAAERKIAGILEHYPSQAGRGWFDADTFRGLMRLRGVECAAPARFAEAFHVAKFTL